MSEYICTVRSNYFHVKDPASFRDFMGRVYGSGDKIFLWQEQDAEGGRYSDLAPTEPLLD